MTRGGCLSHFLWKRLRAVCGNHKTSDPPFQVALAQKTMRNTAANLLLLTIGTLLERLELPLFAILLHKEVSWYSRPLCVSLHLALGVPALPCSFEENVRVVGGHR